MLLRLPRIARKKRKRQIDQKSIFGEALYDLSAGLTAPVIASRYVEKAVRQLYKVRCEGCSCDAIQILCLLRFVGSRRRQRKSVQLQLSLV
jgi:hypothetical protein